MSKPLGFKENRHYGFLVVLSSINYASEKIAMRTAEKLSISLPSEMVRTIRDKVGSGDYSSNSEVTREALRSWMERDQRLKALDVSITNGISDAEAGLTQNINEVRAELLNRFEA
jgi:antitoxin ParD1/3/4